MKKRRLLLFLIPLLLLCSCERKPETSTREEDLNTYSFVRDFSNMHGYRGWSYCYGDVEEPKKMTYDLELCVWRGRDFYAYMKINEQHPGNNSETIIAFTAPKAGMVSVTGSIIRCPAQWSGDGVFFYVVALINEKLEDDYLTSTIVGELQEEAFEYTFTKKLSANDTLYFVINPNKDNSHDQVRNDIVIEFQ